MRTRRRATGFSALPPRLFQPPTRFQTRDGEPCHCRSGTSRRISHLTRALLGFAKPISPIEVIATGRCEPRRGTDRETSAPPGGAIARPRARMLYSTALTLRDRLRALNLPAGSR